jgi:hypothetical protein
MDTLLTLVIAVGGIATGIGAIWAALAARRQAQLTERSLTQTERSLSEQVQTLREQNERARLTLEYDLLSRLTVRINDTPHFRSMKRAAAKYLLDNAFVDDVVALERLNNALMEVCNVLEDVGEMLRLEVLRDVPVDNRFGVFAQAYWFVCKPTIEKMREEWQDPKLYEEFEYLCRVLGEMDRRRGAAPPRVFARKVLEVDATIDEEPPTTTE